MSADSETGVDLTGLDPRIANAINPELRESRIADMTGEIMRRSGFRLSATEAQTRATHNVDFVANVAIRLVELRRGELVDDQGEE